MIISLKNIEKELNMVEMTIYAPHPQRGSLTFTTFYSVSMWKAWCNIRRGLKCDQPSSKPAQLSQRIPWNPCIKDESNQLLGSSKGLSWGYMAEAATT